jgi:hypothetical protein
LIGWDRPGAGPYILVVTGFLLREPAFTARENATGACAKATAFREYGRDAVGS